MGELPSTVDGTRFHVETAHVTVESLQEHSPQSSEEETWGHVQQFTYQDPDYNLEDIYGLRAPEDTNLMLYPLVAPTPVLGSSITTTEQSGVFPSNAEGLHFEGTSSSDLAMSEDAFIPTVVNPCQPLHKCSIWTSTSSAAEKLLSCQRHSW